MIEIDRLTFSYGDRIVLKDFSARLEDGVTVVEGASGGGKTTLLRIIAGLEKPEGGTVSGVPERVGFMFQEDRLLPSFTALENVAAVLKKHERGKAEYWLRLTGLEEYASSLPGALSGGQQRRVALARVLAFGGDLLILDEPLKGLDPELCRTLVPEIKKACRDIIVTSHSEFETALWGGKTLRVE